MAKLIVIQSPEKITPFELSGTSITDLTVKYSSNNEIITISVSGVERDYYR